MSKTIDPTLRSLDACGCCEGVSIETPIEVTNRPGLSAVAYRVGTHAQFKQTLVARLSDPRYAPLRALTTRDDDDFSVALLDAWASVSDVLTFYQERIANESYLRTAGERLSVVELSRLIGYEPRPGVAASTYLAFTLEKVPGATEREAEALGVPSRTVLEPGIKVQSVPGPGEQPQIFETVERVAARVEWNDLRPHMTIRHPVGWGDRTYYFEGLATGIKKGDGILVTPFDKKAVFRLVTDVQLDNERQVTKVTVEKRPSLADAVYGVINDGYEEGPEVAPFVKKYLGRTIDAADLEADARRDGFSVRQLFENLRAARDPAPRLNVFRTRAAIFGHNAPDWSALPATQRVGEYVRTVGFKKGVYAERKDSWINQTLDNYHGSASHNYIFLDNVYQGIAPDSWAVLKAGPNVRAYKVLAAPEVTKSDFTLSAKVTRLLLENRNKWDEFSPRTTTVFAQSEELSLARFPSKEPIEGQFIRLDNWVDGILPGHHIVVSGELSNKRGVTASEVATVLNAEHVLTKEGFTRLKLEVPLAHSYVRSTVRINANVALATHGETVREVLGGGDATRPFQKFTLRQPPLTYTGAATPTGSQTTLSIRVNGLLWHEVHSFYGHGPDERVYVTRTDDDGKTTVMFGDGRTGARLPTGQENVVATYRKGSGLGGLVKAAQLSQLMTRPLGLKGATNPLAAAGASPPESRDAARTNAPLTIMTLGRIVSLRDYEDFARAFAGVGKALATWTWVGEQRGVLVTVAGVGGASIAKGSTLHTNLLTAMRAAGDPAVPLTLVDYGKRFFRLKAKVKVQEDYVAETVLAEVAHGLREHFSFEARRFGQDVTLSEVVSVMQRVAGVVAVDVDQLYRVGFIFFTKSKLFSRLPAAAPRPGTTKTFGAELLTLDPAPPKLEVMP
ncbi:MAG TPA: putative baseplate assembly protein [Pyrinomonadaceae bacterium]|jgi:predicted phage baseplate assembly protein|nr:putative baseplate assembly protein [Pyrinomonadaceae bacterium]